MDGAGNPGPLPLILLFLPIRHAVSSLYTPTASPENVCCVVAHHQQVNLPLMDCGRMPVSPPWAKVDVQVGRWWGTLAQNLHCKELVGDRHEKGSSCAAARLTTGHQVELVENDGDGVLLHRCQLGVAAPIDILSDYWVKAVLLEGGDWWWWVVPFHRHRNVLVLGKVYTLNSGESFECSFNLFSRSVNLLLTRSRME